MVSFFSLKNVSQLRRAARHWGQRLEIVRGREGVPEDIVEAQRSKGRTAKLKELEAPTLGSKAGDFIRTGNLPFSDGSLPVCPKDTEGPEARLAARLSRLGNGAYTGEPDHSDLPSPEESRISRVPWACPHLYRIKCFVY